MNQTVGANTNHLLSSRESGMLSGMLSKGGSTKSTPRAVRWAAQWVLLLGLMAGSVWSPACGPKEGPTETKEESGTTKDAAVVDAGNKCQFPSDCASLGQTCKQGECLSIICKDDNECRGGWVCRKNTCYDRTKAPCAQNEDCTQDPTKWKCDDGTCIDGGCRKDEDCTDPKLPVCDVVAHACLPKKCSSDSDCIEPIKPICDKDTGECGGDKGAQEGEECEQTSCLRSLGCFNDNGKRTCRLPCVPGDSKVCKSPTLCIPVNDPNHKAYCLEPGAGGKAGEDCSGGGACQRHLECTYTGEAETCRLPCRVDTDCDSSERCLEHKNKRKVCQPKPPPCGTGRSCPGEEAGWQRCTNGACLLLLCPDDIICPITHKCEKNGQCVPLACPTDKCPDLYKCSNGKCVRTNEGEKCGQGETVPTDGCGDNLTCTRVGYVASCVRTCDTGQCPTGFDCVTNTDQKKICMQSCPTPPTRCNYPGHFCLDLKRNPTGNYCVPPGQPSGQDAYEKCDNQTTCLPDMTCFQNNATRGGYCGLPCKADTDCNSTNPNGVCASYGSFGPICMVKCPSSGSCTVAGVTGYCYRATSSTVYICRPS